MQGLGAPESDGEDVTISEGEGEEEEEEEEEEEKGRRARAGGGVAPPLVIGSPTLPPSTATPFPAWPNLWNVVSSRVTGKRQREEATTERARRVRQRLGNVEERIASLEEARVAGSPAIDHAGRLGYEKGLETPTQAFASTAREYAALEAEYRRVSQELADALRAAAELREAASAASVPNEEIVAYDEQIQSSLDGLEEAISALEERLDALAAYVPGVAELAEAMAGSPTYAPYYNLANDMIVHAQREDAFVSMCVTGPGDVLNDPPLPDFEAFADFCVASAQEVLSESFIDPLQNIVNDRMWVIEQLAVEGSTGSANVEGATATRLEHMNEEDEILLGNLELAKGEFGPQYEAWRYAYGVLRVAVAVLQAHSDKFETADDLYEALDAAIAEEGLRPPLDPRNALLSGYYAINARSAYGIRATRGEYVLPGNVGELAATIRDRLSRTVVTIHDDVPQLLGVEASPTQERRVYLGAVLARLVLPPWYPQGQ